MHVGSDAGDKHADALDILIASAKFNGIDPKAYLHYVLERITDYPMNCVHDGLPWIIAAQLARNEAALRLAALRALHAAPSMWCGPDAYGRQGGAVRTRHPLHHGQLSHAQQSEDQGVASRMTALKIHFIPTYGSTFNQVERFFALITDTAIRRCSLISVKQLAQRIAYYVVAHNAKCQSFNWTATIDSILKKLHRLCSRIAGTGH